LYIVIIISHIKIIGNPHMIMIGYSSLIIVGSIELIIFAQCVTQISRLIGMSKQKNYIIQCFVNYTNTVSNATGPIRFEVNYSRIRRNCHQLNNRWWL